MENGEKPKLSINENKHNLSLIHFILIYLSKHKKSISFEVRKGFSDSIADKLAEMRVTMAKEQLDKFVG